MTQIHWAHAVSGGFTNAADWIGGVVPGAGDDAILDAAGSPYSVTSSADTTVGDIQTAANATLVVSGGTFTATGGTGGGVNAGTITVTDGFFSVGGTVANTGAIFVGTDAHAIADLLIAKGGLTLTGGGTVTVGFNSYIIGSSLTNVDNTITGYFNYNRSGDRLVNEAGGVIDVTSQAGGAIYANTTNAGLIEVSNFYLSIGGILNNGASGVLLTYGSGILALGGTIVGGTIKTSGAGSVVAVGGAATLDGRASQINNQAKITVSTFNNFPSTLTVEGLINNTGSIVLSSFGTPTTSLIVGGMGATLSGDGHVLMNVSTNNIITGASSQAVLTNVDNFIMGAGQLGAGAMTLINQAGGAIISTHSVGLVIDTGGATVANAGLIESRGVGGLTIQSAVANSGRLEAIVGTLTANGSVTGAGEGVVAGGTLDFASSFDEKVVFLAAGGVLELGQSQSYAGAVYGFSQSGKSAFDLRDIGFVNDGEASFSGTTFGGVLTVTDGAHTARIHLQGNYTASTFVASSDGQGGTTIVSSAAHAFVAAMAGLGAGAGSGTAIVAHADAWRPTLLAPRAQAA